MSDEDDNARQKPSSEALEAIRAMLMAPLPDYKYERPKQPLKPEKTIERRNSGTPTAKRQASTDAPD